MSKTVELLERALAVDQDAISRLILTRVECNEELSTLLSPFIQMTKDEHTVDEQGNPVPVYSVRIIGLLNSILKANGLTMVAGRYSDNRTSTVGFLEVLGVDDQTGAVNVSLWQPHQRRVMIEHEELNEKLWKLHEFINGSDTFKELPTEEQDRLKRQLTAMSEYHGILAERIDAFAVPAE